MDMEWRNRELLGDVGPTSQSLTAMELERRNSEPMVSDSYELQNTNCGYEILSQLNDLRTSNCFTDAILCVGAEEFHCHRNVLAASSPYFRAMFCSDLRESKEGRILFSDIPSWTVELIIDYIYTGSLTITTENAQEVLAAGSIFQFPSIVDACCKFLGKHLHASNCLGIEHFAHMHACPSLETESHKFALENFSAVIEHEEFLELPLERLITYLASDLIDVRSEVTVYDAALKWVHNLLEERSRHLPTILDHVRLATVDIDYLCSVIELDPLVQASDYCLKLVHEARIYHESGQDSQGVRRRSMQTENYQPRPSTVAKEVLVVVGGNTRANSVIQSVEMYDPHKDKWHHLPDLPQCVSRYSVAALGNDIFVTGGIVDGIIVSNVWRFDSSNRKWFESKSMTHARARHASSAWNDKLYVMGGMGFVVDSKLVPMESIECYDMLSHAWTVIGQSPFPRQQSHIVPCNQTLVEVGGLQNGARVQTIESYLCSEETVTYSGEQFVLPESIQFAQIAVHNGLFYIIWEDTKKVITLNAEKRTFRRMREMHHVHISGGATMLNGKIYITGGLRDSEPSRICECYDPSTNIWTEIKMMRQARSCHGCVTIQMN